MNRNNDMTYKRSASTLPDETFYEIEYDTTPFPGVGRFVRTSEKLTPPEDNEDLQLRRRFQRMREIARSNHIRYPQSQFFDPVVRNHNAKIFYEQALFMEDFTDEYDDISNFTSYYPSYQQMGVEQLRTYFTWRTQVRKGIISEIPLSYAYVYLYELLMNIGVSDPEEGRERLFSFWNEFRDYDDSIDQYVPRWLKDYHIYYPLSESFEDFVKKKNLTAYFPELAAPQDDFALFRPLSRYEIEKSSFYTEEQKELIHDCFLFVIKRLRQLFSRYDLDFDVTIFRPAHNMTAWTPFQKALFHPWLAQPDRRVVLSPQELYVCCGGKWTTSALLLSERNRRFITYIFKQMEASLRQVTQFRYKLSVKLGAVSEEILFLMEVCGVSFEAVIHEAVLDFYREWNKVIIQVDEASLRRIRQEALVTQERLTVPETTPLWETAKQESVRQETFRQEFFQQEATSLTKTDIEVASIKNPIKIDSVKSDPLEADLVGAAPTDSLSPWTAFGAELTNRERHILSALLYGETSLPAAARVEGILPEVLAEGINEKAVDCIGDSLMDEEFQIYEDYREPLKQLLEAK